MHKYSRSMRPTPMASRAHLPRRKWWFVLLALCGLVLAGGIGPLPSAAKPLPPAVSPLPAQPADLREGNWTNLYPGLRAVSAAAASDAWAGGEYGRLLHFTGGAWTVVDPPVLRGHDITDLRMLADGSGWLAADG